MRQNHRRAAPAIDPTKNSTLFEVPFTRSRRTLEHDWARLSCLVYELKWRRMSGVVAPLDVGLLQSYERDLESVEDKRNAMEAEVARFRAEKAINPAYTNDVLHRTIRSSLYKLYILLACAVRFNKQPHDDIDLALRPFGFQLSRSQRPTNNKDLMLVGMTVMAVCILVLEFSAVGVAQLHPWPVTPFFPQSWYQPFLDAITSLIVCGVSIWAADLLRSRSIRNGSWFASMGIKRRANAANYIRVGFASAIAGYFSLIVWGLTQAPLTPDQLKMEAPFMLLAAVTGGFYAYHLDNVELEQRPSRLCELGLQGAAIAICWLIAAASSFAILLGDASLAFDKILLTAATGAIAGAALAWYIPQAAASIKSDPLLIVREERVRMLELASRKRFNSSRMATEWLEQPHPALNNRSPHAAAADVEGFEQAINLLRTPQAVAV